MSHRLVPLLLLALLPAISSCDSPTVEAQPPQGSGGSGQVAAHTHDALDVVSGWFNDERFSPTIRIIDRDTIRFRGVVGWGGGPVLEDSELGGVLTGFRQLQERHDELRTAFDSFREHHEHDLEDFTSGTLPDQRLSGNVALLSSPLTTFEGALAWGGGVPIPTSNNAAGGGGGLTGVFSDVPNVFTAPQTFNNRLMSATFTGDPVEGSGTIGLRFDRNRDTELSPLGISWTMNGAERWALGLDEGAGDHPDFVILYNTGRGDIFRVAEGAHFQMGAGIGPTPTENLLFLNDRDGSGNATVLNMQSSGTAERWIQTVLPNGDVPFAVGRDGSVGVGGDYPQGGELKLNVAGRARAEAWETTSDARLKEDVRPLTGALERLARLQAVQFRWKESGEADLGVLAQEVEKVFPELVREHDGVKSVDYSGLTAVVLAAVVELAGRCETPAGKGAGSP